MNGILRVLVGVAYLCCLGIFALDMTHKGLSRGLVILERVLLGVIVACALAVPISIWLWLP